MHLNLPQREIKLKKDSGRIFIYDRLRHKYIILTPEEYVRQNFVNYLIEDLSYPEGLMGNEISLIQNGIKRRCDTLITDIYGSPFIIVEYKAPSIEITQNVFDQIIRYNSVFKAKYLIVSNGLRHFACKMTYDPNGFEFLTSIPDYKALIERTK